MTDISESGLEAALDPAYADGPFYYVPMPVNSRGQGPEMDETKVVWTQHEVWNSNTLSIGTFANEAVARWVADRLNAFHPPAREEGLRVKELAWEVEEPNWWVARSIVGGYEVRQTDSGKVRTRRVGEGWEYFDGTTEQAKSAAQEHYTNAILSAIETALIPTKPEAKESAIDLALIEATARKINPGRSEDHIKSVALDALTIFRALQSKKPE